MTRPRALLLGAGVLLIATSIVWWALRSADRPEVERLPVVAVAASPEMILDVPFARDDVVGLDVPAQAAREVEREFETARIPAASRVAAFVEAVRAADAGPLAAFHDAVNEVAVAFLEDVHDAHAQGACGDELLARLDDDVVRPRVRGVLLGVVRASGFEQQAAERWTSDEESMRLAIALGAWAPGDTADPAIVPLDLGDFVARNQRGGFRLLPIVTRRLVGEPVRGMLLRRVREFANDWDPLLTRDAAILALGAGVDVDDEILPVLAELLFDPYAAQIDDAILYVLVHARREAARATLLRFLADDAMPEHAKLKARWLMSGKPLLDGELEELTRPFRESGPDASGRIMAAGALLKRLAQADGREKAAIEEILVERARVEENGTARLAALAVLARDVVGGGPRVAALADRLRHDDLAVCRGMAADGLARVPEDLRSEALGALRAALATEADPNVLADIRHALALLEG